MASKAGKRPSRQATPAEKLAAIQRVNNGESKASVARDISVPESTLRGWCKNENKIRMETGKLLEGDMSTESKAKRMKVDDNSNSIEQPYNLSVKSPQVLPPTNNIDSKSEQEINHTSPKIKLEDGSASFSERENSNRNLGSSMLNCVSSNMILPQNGLDYPSDTQNKKTSLEISVSNNFSQPSVPTQSTPLLATTQPGIKQTSPNPPKENQQPCHYQDLLTYFYKSPIGHQLYQYMNNYNPESYNARSQSLYEQIQHYASQFTATALTQCAQLMQKSSENGKNDRLLYQQLTKPVIQSTRQPPNQHEVVVPQKEQDFAEDLSLNSRSSPSRSPYISPTSSHASSNFSNPSPNPMVQDGFSARPMSTPIPNFVKSEASYGGRNNGDETTSHRLNNSAGQSSSNTKNNKRKILKPKFEINNLLPENDRNNDYLTRNSHDSGFNTSEDEDELRISIEAGEKFLKFLESGKIKSVTHFQVGQLRDIVTRVKRQGKKEEQPGNKEGTNRPRKLISRKIKRD